LIVDTRTFDPDGDDGAENDDAAPLAIDGDPDTSWSTSCYEGQFLNGKRALGLVVTLARPVSGTITIAIESAPYQVEVFAVSGATPSTLDGWGTAIAKSNDDAPGDLAVPLIEPVDHVLVSFREGGPSGQCSEANPFRGTIAEISVAPLS
jgi:hypothetical protein